MVSNLMGSDEPPEPLYAALSGAGEQDVLLLHGLFGMGSNLGGLARALAPFYRVHQLDLPNHGRSPWQTPSNLGGLAASVAGYLDGLGGKPAALVGHSLGGKVVMQLALHSPEHVAALVVADIAPIAYSASHGAVFAALEAVTAAAPRSRGEAAGIMRSFVEEDGVLQFLMLSLRREATGVYSWRFNVKGLGDSYAAIREAPGGTTYGGPALFVSGELSAYVNASGEAAARALFPQAGFTTLEGAGHWLHAEKPEEFNSAVLGFLHECFATETTAAPDDEVTRWS
ncbi:MAG: esterase [Halieaceae bacterium]|jgi:esterase